MMYSQQEYEMVRRQTMQIEAEKRAALRLTLIIIALLLAASLVLTALMYRNYSTADHRIKTAETKAAEIEQQYKKVSMELAEKQVIIDANKATLGKQNEVIDSIVPKMLGKAAKENEIAELAHAIYQQPGHVITLAGIPPDNVLRRYRIRIDGKPHSYVLVAGLVDGKWLLYSNLVKNQED